MKRKLLINIMLLLLSIIICYLLSEIYAARFLKKRYFTFQGVGYEFQRQPSNKKFIFDEKLGFRPGSSWSGSEGRYGCQNGREYENSIESKDFKNILMLGDSVIQYRHLEEALKCLLKDRPFRIWNIGIGGYNTWQEARYLKKYIKIKPDILILGFCLNDFIPSMTIISSDNKEMMFA